MKSSNKTLRFIYHTKGVCPPEIHFQIQEDVLREVRFVGGGCPGNAEAVSRLLKERPIKEVLALIQGIPCRNDTSCPDQLTQALLSVQEGALNPARSFRIHTDPEPRKRMALIGDLQGRGHILRRLLDAIQEERVEIVYCLGNLTGNSSRNKELIGLIRKKGVLAIQGELDWQYAQGRESDDLPHLEEEERDHLALLPQVLSFQIGPKKGMAFFGGYIQDLPGFSDFEPFALEINIVCGLTRFLQDETVFPALKAMVPQFSAQIVLFSQSRNWGHWQIGGVDFISLGPALDATGPAWGLLEANGDGISFKIMKVM